MTGFEPATPRPPGVYATGLRYIPIPIRVAKITKHSNWQGRNFICFNPIVSHIIKSHFYKHHKEWYIRTLITLSPKT